LKLSRILDFIEMKSEQTLPLPLRHCAKIFLFLLKTKV